MVPAEHKPSCPLRIPSWGGGSTSTLLRALREPQHSRWLRRHAAAITLISVVVLAVALLVGLAESRAALRRWLDDSLTIAATRRAHDLDAWVSARRTTLNVVAASLPTAPGAPLVGSAVEGSLVAALGQLPDASELALLGPDGAVIAATHPDLTARDCDPATTTAGPDGHLWSPVSVDLLRHDARLCGLFDLTAYVHTIDAHVPPHGELYVVGRNGAVLIGPESTPLQGHVDVGDGTTPRAVHLTGRTNAAYVPVAGRPWGVVATLPDDLVAARIGAPWRGLLAIGAALALTAIAVIASQAGQWLRRVDSLADAAERITSTPPSSGLASAEERIADVLDRVAAQLAPTEVAPPSDAVLDAFEHAITVIHPDQSIVLANRAAQAKYGADVVGRTCGAVFEACGGASCETCPLTVAVRARRPCRWERPHGRSALEALAYCVYPILSDAGEVTGAVLVEQRVTEQRRMFAKLIQQEKLASLGVFAAGFAHELGNPLGSISSELQMMQMFPDPAEHAASLRVVREELDRMTRLLRRFTELGAAPPHTIEAVEFGAIARDVHRLLGHHPRLGTTRIALQIGSTGRVWANRDQLTQIVLNLGLNALDASGGTGDVALVVADDGPDVVLEVIDAGPGIPAEILPQIFEPFFTTKPEGRGTGLGLFVTQGLVTDLGGRIDVWSEVGRGARFTVRLPRMPEEVAHDGE